MKVKEIIVTPKVAQQMLAKNTNNYRNLNKSTVDMYAKLMTDGLWQENGEPIHFNKKGELTNGQHRLHAIVKSGCAQNMLVVYDVDNDTNIYDVGRVRSWGDYTFACGEKLNNIIGGALTILVGYADGRNKVPHAERRQYYLRHDDELNKAHRMGNSGAHRAVLRKSGCVAAIYCAMRLNILSEKEMDTFCTICNSGFPLEGAVNEPPLGLRRTLTEGVRNNEGFVRNGSMQVKGDFDVTYQAIQAYARKSKAKKTYKANNIWKEVVGMVRAMPDD